MKRATTMAYVNNQGVHIYYEVEGEGPPLVLQHGLSESLEVWRIYGVVDRLKAHYRLILIDARGHGRSDKPHDPERYTLGRRATDVVAVLDDLHLSTVHYWGYSMGGWIGLELACCAPDRLRSLIVGGAQPYGQSMAMFRQLLSQGLAAWEAVVEQMAGHVSPAVKTIVRANDVQALLAANAHDRPNIADMLPTLRMPCLFYAGDADPLHPLIERCASEIAGATFVSLPGLNHIQTAIRYDLVLPHVLRFLTGLDQQASREMRVPLRHEPLLVADNELHREQFYHACGVDCEPLAQGPEMGTTLLYSQGVPPQDKE